MYTKAANKAVQKYCKKNYDNITIRTSKGKREMYKAYAKSQGKSLNALIVELLEKEIKEEKA